MLVHGWSVVTVGLSPLSRSQDLLVLGVPQTNAEGEERREGEEKAYCDQIWKILFRYFLYVAKVELELTM